MYLVGSDHPNKIIAEQVIKRLIQQRERIVTDAEVFQEILHRYTAIKRPEFIEPCFDLLRRTIDEVFPVDIDTVELARSILLAHKDFSARDAVHVASMKVHHVFEIFTFDVDFDRIRDIFRLST